jgi:glycosyltransferase involved in cell wall biosynthesis
MNKRILIFSTAYHPFIGGAEIAIKEITDRISDCEFDMITTNLDGKQHAVEKIGNVTVYRMGKGTLGKFLLPFMGFFKARNLHATKKYDVVWSMMASQASIAASFFKITHSDIPLVLTVQEGDEESHLARYTFNNSLLFALFIRPLHRLVFKKANRITAISNYLAIRASKINSTAPLTIIPNGVNIPLFSQKFSDAEREHVIKEIGKEEGDRIIITTSRLVLKNAVEDVVMAMTKLPSSVKFVILGVGPLESDIRKTIDTFNLQKRVVFLGHQEYKDIPKYLAVSDVFVRPSLSEGMGNSFIEAMAAGVPVVATAVGGIPDFLKDHETGLICEVHNPESIAEKIQLLLNDTILREKIKLYARNLVAEKYNWDQIAVEMKKVF